MGVHATFSGPKTRTNRPGSAAKKCIDDTRRDAKSLRATQIRTRNEATVRFAMVVGFHVAFWQPGNPAELKSSKQTLPSMSGGGMKNPSGI